MSLIVAKSTNMGVIKASLSTVGYTIKGSNGATVQARTTSGITEIVSGKGIYGGLITFADDFSGFLIWDTGDASPYYAVENIDGRTYKGAGGGVALHMPVQKKLEVWSLDDKKKMFKNLKTVMEAIKSSNEKSDVIKENLVNGIKSIREGELKILIDRRIDFSNLENALKELRENVCAIKDDKIDFSSVEQKLLEVKNLIESQSELFAPIIEGVTALIESEQAKNVQGET